MKKLITLLCSLFLITSLNAKDSFQLNVNDSFDNANTLNEKLDTVLNQSLEDLSFMSEYKQEQVDKGALTDGPKTPLRAKYNAAKTMENSATALVIVDAIRYGVAEALGVIQQADGKYRVDAFNRVTDEQEEDAIDNMNEKLSKFGGLSDDIKSKILYGIQYSLSSYNMQVFGTVSVPEFGLVFEDVDGAKLLLKRAFYNINLNDGPTSEFDSFYDRRQNVLTARQFSNAFALSITNQNANPQCQNGGSCPGPL